MRCLCWVVSLIATVTFGNASLISLEFTDSHICDQYYLSKVLRTRESHPIIIHLHLVGYLLKFNDIRVSYFDKNNNILSCDIYSQQIHQETSSCARKELHDNAMKEDMLILSSPIHSSGEYLEVCLVPDVPDLNLTNISQPTQSPTSKSRISAPTHPFMSTQAILIPLILFSLIAFGGLSYYFQLYRHLPFCAKPSGFLQFEDEFSSTMSEEEEGIVNFDFAPPPSSPNSYAIVDKSGISSPIISKTQLRRHVDTFTNRIDDMLSAAREGVSKFPTGVKGGSHHRLPTDVGDEGDSGHDKRQNKVKHNSLDGDDDNEEITVELMTI